MLDTEGCRLINTPYSWNGKAVKPHVSGAGSDNADVHGEGTLAGTSS